MKSRLINVSENGENRTHNIIEIILSFNLFLLVFFTFFGTDIPFQEVDLAARYEAEGSNIINQILFAFLFISSVTLIIKNPTNTLNFIRKEKYLAIFIVFCLLSAIWSSYSLLSFKRSFQLLTTYMVLMNSVLFLPYRSIIRVIKIILFTYVIVTIFSGLFISQAIDPDFKTWRGIEIQKNMLGQKSLLIFVLSLLFFEKDQNRISKVISYSVLILSGLIILLAYSSTNIMGLGLVLFLLVIFFIETIFKPIGAGRYTTVIIILFAFCLSITVILFSKETLELITGMLGKDLSFSGRTEIWAYLWPQAMKKFWLGYGYCTYWVMNSPRLAQFQYFFDFQINEAHNGYLEIMLQLGFIGILLLVFFIVSFAKRALKIDNKVALISLVAVFLLNFTEATIFALRSSTTFVIIFFYLIVSFNLFHKK